MSAETLTATEAKIDPKNRPSREQRKSPRHEYARRQLVASFDGTRMPEQDEFAWAMFRDVSATGVSFLTKKKPAGKLFVVAMGPAPFSFLVVEVVRCSRRDDLSGRPYHVGCSVVRELTD